MLGKKRRIGIELWQQFLQAYEGFFHRPPCHGKTWPFDGIGLGVFLIHIGQGFLDGGRKIPKAFELLVGRVEILDKDSWCLRNSYRSAWRKFHIGCWFFRATGLKKQQKSDAYEKCL